MLDHNTPYAGHYGSVLAKYCIYARTRAACRLERRIKRISFLQGHTESRATLQGWVSENHYARLYIMVLWIQLCHWLIQIYRRLFLTRGTWTSCTPDQAQCKCHAIISISTIGIQGHFPKMQRDREIPVHFNCDSEVWIPGKWQNLVTAQQQDTAGKPASHSRHRHLPTPLNMPIYTGFVSKLDLRA